MKSVLLCLLGFLAICNFSLHADEFETELIRQINVERGKQKLAPLQPDPYLMEVARVWARDMVKKDKLAHRQNMGLIMEKAGYEGLNENLYYTTFPLTADSTVNAWMNSSGHLKNLLTARMTLVGVGYAQDAKGAKYVVFNSAVKAPPPKAVAVPQ